jgi:hypothetical protein
MRNPTWRRRVWPLGGAAAVVAAAVIAGCGAGTPAAVTGPGAAAEQTQRVNVSPVTSAGAAVRGYRVTSHAAGASCEPGSEAIGQAYRCFAGNGVYDPCWAEKAATPTVLCVADPWLHTAAELKVSSPLSAIPSESGASTGQPSTGQPGTGQSWAGEPWGVQLTSGQRCLLAQGAHNSFHGQVIDYYCTSSLSLLRGLDHAPATWTARSVLAKSGQLASGPAEKIAIAWYGIPARYR